MSPSARQLRRSSTILDDSVASGREWDYRDRIEPAQLQTQIGVSSMHEDSLGTTLRTIRLPWATMGIDCKQDVGGR